MGKPLPVSFFCRPTLRLARALLGAKLVTQVNGRKTTGMIVEVEAYHGELDRAAHSFGGRTARNEVMFRSAGHCYVYFIYGMHHCVNVVSERRGTGAAVLIRAIQPLEGLATMARRRKLGIDSRMLTNGPARLCQAMGIGPSLSGHHFGRSNRIWIEPYLNPDSASIASSRRIGISKSRHLNWRFYLRGNRWVSGPKKLRN